MAVNSSVEVAGEGKVLKCGIRYVDGNRLGKETVSRACQSSLGKVDGVQVHRCVQALDGRGSAGSSLTYSNHRSRLLRAMTSKQRCV